MLAYIVHMDREGGQAQQPLSAAHTQFHRIGYSTPIP